MKAKPAGPKTARRTSRPDRSPRPARSKSDAWVLRLYVAGQTPKSLTAFANLKNICEAHLKGKYKIEVVDLLQNPQLARGDQILAIPTLVRKLPLPFRRIIGDCSNAEHVLIGLGLRPRAAQTFEVSESSEV